MRRLIFVRHAPVALRGGVHARDWRLTDEGRRLAAALARADVFAGATLVATSPEPKAHATAAPIAEAAAAPLRADDRLVEVDRGLLDQLPRAEYVALVGAYLGGANIGWEPAAVARARFAAATADLSAATGGDLVVVTHGLVLSLYLDLSLAEWDAMPLPAVAVVEGDSRTTFRAVDDL